MGPLVIAFSFSILKLKFKFSIKLKFSKTKFVHFYHSVDGSLISLMASHSCHFSHILFTLQSTKPHFCAYFFLFCQ